jgi:hypothetical protein
VRRRTNWLTFIVPVLLIATLAIGRFVRVPQPLRVVRPETETAPADGASMRDIFALQVKCLRQGDSLYAALGYPKGRIAGSRTHYNQKLGKCFLDLMNVETATRGAVWIHRRVIDATLEIGYGGYSALVPRDASASDVPPQRCDVRLPSGELRLCRSEAEFEYLADVYLEEN